jgi:hypothetical protein
MVKTQTHPWDVVQHLEIGEGMAAYLEAALDALGEEVRGGGPEGMEDLCAFPVGPGQPQTQAVTVAWWTSRPAQRSRMTSMGSSCVAGAQGDFKRRDAARRASGDRAGCLKLPGDKLCADLEYQGTPTSPGSTAHAEHTPFSCGAVGQKPMTTSGSLIKGCCPAGVFAVVLNPSAKIWIRQDGRNGSGGQTKRQTSPKRSENRAYFRI